jgi:hypothetical protein
MTRSAVGVYVLVLIVRRAIAKGFWDVFDVVEGSHNGHYVHVV